MIIKNFDELSLNNDRKYVLEILDRSLRNLDPARVMERVASERFPPGLKDQFYVYGIGKASQSMYSGLRSGLGDRIKKAIILIPQDEDCRLRFSELLVLRGSHPFPSPESVKSTEEIIEDLQRRMGSDHVIFLISGGGSALFELPEEGLSVNDIASTTKCVMNLGADIMELNSIRILMSRVKGGKTLDHVVSDSIDAFYISDVLGNDLRFIASGPLVRSHFDHEKVLKKFSQCLKKGFRPTIDNSSLKQERVRNTIILSNRDFVDFIRREIGEDRCLDLGTEISGDVETASINIMGILREASKTRKDVWFAGAGETTVTVKGSGKGGRNQELCLHILRNLQDTEDIVFVSAGTDGIDGASPAMGGIVDRQTLDESSVHEIEETIENNDSYTFLSKHHGSIMTGRTGNNVSDVMFGRFRRKA